MKIHNFKELKVWQKSMELSVQIYKLTSFFPKDERFGLISQVQRAAVSIPSNIAEGCGRISNKELSRFIAFAMGSCYELETQMILANRFEYIKEENQGECFALIAEVQKMLYGFYNSLNVAS